MDKKAWIIFSVVVVALFGGLIFLSGKNKIDVNDVDATKLQTGLEASGGIGDHVFGKKDSKVVLVEYGDFQCPGCFGAHSNIKQLSEKYEGQVAFVFRNFPLTSIHPNALAAAAVVEAAGLQGKYWEMNNSLFENQDSWKESSAQDRTQVFIGLAEELKLDVEKFKTDLASEDISKKIAYDIALGKKQGVSGTPSFYLNGERLSEDITNDVIRDSGTKLELAITSQLQKNNISLPTDKE